jgi:hypothetical protein
MSRFNQIVSANFHDRGGHNTQMPWLIRNFDEKPELAKPAKAIVATGVVFGPSSDHELGFGCAVVAYCESATAIEADSKEGVRVRFAGENFYDPDRTPLLAVDKLILNSDGSMYAVPSELAATATAVSAAAPAAERVRQRAFA